MNIIRWEPRRSIFGELSNTFLSDLFDTGAERESRWIPKIELGEKNGNYVVKAELAGVDKKDISVDLNDGLLTIKAEKKAEKEEKKKNYTYSEFSYGSFQRSVAVPKGLKADDIKATYEKGLLEITLPKKEEEKVEAKKIEIK